MVGCTGQGGTVRAGAGQQTASSQICLACAPYPCPPPISLPPPSPYPPYPCPPALTCPFPAAATPSALLPRAQDVSTAASACGSNGSQSPRPARQGGGVLGGWGAQGVGVWGETRDLVGGVAPNREWLGVAVVGEDGLSVLWSACGAQAGVGEGHVSVHVGGCEVVDHGGRARACGWVWPHRE